MKPTSATTGSLLVSTLFGLIGTAAGHSWVERVMRLALNGTMVGTPGYDRNHIRRDEAFDDKNVVWKLPPDDAPINSMNKTVKHPLNTVVKPQLMALTEASYPPEFPMLKAAPGDFIAIQHMENGHVTRPEFSDTHKPINRGTIYLYGTTQNDLSGYNIVDVHLTWTADGKGGDGKGRLLATRNYDDGRCHQALPIDGDLTGMWGVRNSAFPPPMVPPMNDALWCQSDVQIPSDLKPGQTYTMLWVWDWPTMSKTGVKVPPATYDWNATLDGPPHITGQQIYTSVVDLAIVDACDDSLGPVKGPGCKSAGTKTAVHFQSQDDLSVAGVRAQMENPWMVQVPQADSKVKSATAPDSVIPFYGLIGIETTKWALPLPSDVLAKHLVDDGKNGAPGNPEGGDSTGPTSTGNVQPTKSSGSPSVPSTAAPSTATRPSAAPSSATPPGATPPGATPPSATPPSATSSSAAPNMPTGKPSTSPGRVKTKVVTVPAATRWVTRTRGGKAKPTESPAPTEDNERPARPTVTPLASGSSYEQGGRYAHKGRRFGSR